MDEEEMAKNEEMLNKPKRKIQPEQKRKKIFLLEDDGPDYESDV